MSVIRGVQLKECEWRSVIGGMWLDDSNWRVIGGVLIVTYCDQVWHHITMCNDECSITHYLAETALFLF